MKRSRYFVAGMLLVLVAAVITPACSKKTGCPTVTHASDVFDQAGKKSSKKH